MSFATLVAPCSLLVTVYTEYLFPYFLFQPVYVHACLVDSLQLGVAFCLGSLVPLHLK